ncbi:MAG: MOSC domain-containing protein [Planctomycetes bacterium]|nr:MOSC domain-containing protein [Planctomycetota bacterium]
MSNAAKVLHLCIAPEGGAPLLRSPQDQVKLVKGKGIEGDRKFGQSKTRQINVITQRSYPWFEQSFGRKLKAPGAFGEQVVISDDIDLNWLPVGTKLSLGEAVIEIAYGREPCLHMAGNLGADKAAYFVGHVGVLCRVIKGGVVRVGDRVEVIALQPAQDLS